MNIKDYLHLYKDVLVQVKRKNDSNYFIGRVCEISSRSNHGDWIMVWFDDVITVVGMNWNESTSNAHHFFFNEDDIKPILRPLSDMTEKEAEELANVIYGDAVNKDRIVRVYQIAVTQEFMQRMGGSPFRMTQWTTIFKMLLEWNFDIFGLIENGLALDKTKLNNQ